MKKEGVLAPFVYVDLNEFRPKWAIAVKGEMSVMLWSTLPCLRSVVSTGEGDDGNGEAESNKATMFAFMLYASWLLRLITFLVQGAKRFRPLPAWTAGVPPLRHCRHCSGPTELNFGHGASRQLSDAC